MIRALIADDSPTARHLLRSILEKDPGISIVGEAENGELAVRMVVELRPDIVIMDVHMPVYDGIQATRAIMSKAPTPILIVSSVSRHDVDLSLTATEAGALMALAKPGGPNSPRSEQAAEELRSMTRAMANVKVVRRWAGPAGASDSAANSALRARGQVIDVVAIGASTGGPSAVRQILAEIPATFAAPILLVQHIAHDFAAGFADWLSSETPLTVKLAEHGETLKAGRLYIAPDNHHLGVLPAGRVGLATTPPISGFRPSATYLFESVSREYGRRMLAAILTGMGSDGAEGLRAAHSRGSFVIAQDEGSSVVFGMAQEAIRLGAVDMVLPLDRIGSQLIEIVQGRN